MIVRSLKIDVGRIQPRNDAVQCFAGHVTVGNPDIFQSFFMGQFHRFQSIFQENGGLGIGIGNGWTIIFDSLRNMFRRRNIDALNIQVGLGTLGYFPVLAPLAAEIAAWRGNGKRGTARQKVIEWFFLNRVYVRGY